MSEYATKQNRFTWLALSTIGTTFLTNFINNLTILERNNQQEETPAYLTVMIAGRLGNQLFQVASLIGIAKTLNRQPVIPVVTLESLGKWFPNLRSFVLPIPQNLTLIPIGVSLPACCQFDPTLYTRIEPRKNYTINDWVFSWKYCKTDIPSIFKYKIHKFCNSITVCNKNSSFKLYGPPTY